MGEKPIKTIIIKKESLKPFIMNNKQCVSDNNSNVFRLNQPIHIPILLSNKTVKLDDKIIIIKKEEISNVDFGNIFEDVGNTLCEPSDSKNVTQITDTGLNKISTRNPLSSMAKKIPASNVKPTKRAPKINTNNIEVTKELMIKREHDTEWLKKELMTKREHDTESKAVTTMHKIKILTTEVLPSIVIAPKLEIISNLKLDNAKKTEDIKQKFETQYLEDSNQDMSEDDCSQTATAASSWQGQYEELIMGKPKNVEEVKAIDDWECPMCNELFDTEQQKDEHMNAEHTCYYECIECGHTTDLVESAREHFMLEHRSQQDVEESAGADDEYILPEKTHIQVFEVEGGKKDRRTWKCAHCSMEFSSAQHYRQHIIKHKPEGELPDHFCWECNMLLSSAEAYNRHILTARKHKPHRKTINNGCRFCGMTFSTKPELERHIKNGHSRKRRGIEIEWPQTCTMCGELQENSVKYWAHTRKMHPGEQYPLRAPYDHKCDVCGKEFRCLAVLKEHKNRHTGVKPYPCNQCDKRFYSKLSWQAHQAAHSDERPFRCPTCNRGFKFKHGMERHQLVHTGERPFQCSLCGRGFTTLHWTQMHVRRVHNNEYIPYKSRIRNKRKKRAVAEPVDWSTAEEYEEYDGIDDEVEIHSTGFA